MEALGGSLRRGRPASALAFSPSPTRQPYRPPSPQPASRPRASQDEHRFALSSPARRSLSPGPRVQDPAAGHQLHTILPHKQLSPPAADNRATIQENPSPFLAPRPGTAPTLRSTGPVQQGSSSPDFKKHGRISLFDKGGPTFEFLGPKVLRDLPHSQIGLPLKGPDQFLKKDEGKGLRLRNNITQWLKRHPVNREPPFQPGNAGVKLFPQQVPTPGSIFRYLYDLGTIDFVTLRWGGLQNHIEWGKQIRPGLMSWGPKPSEVNIGKWLPIFLEGIREYEEPYRFMAIKGSESLILEAGSRLMECANDCVQPLRKALESREPTTVAVALELMLLAIKVEPKVATVWIYQLWQFAQVMNLFLQKVYVVNMGYNKREIASIRQLVTDIYHLLEEHGGEHATGLIRRYCRGVDPAVTPASMARRTKQEQSKETFRPWKPFTLF